MENITVGIVPAPELPATIAYKLSGSLADALNEQIPGDIKWQVEVEIDRLTGAAEKVKEIMDEALHLKEDNKWDYVISLTDLPVLYRKSVVVADADIQNSIAQVSLPAFGMTPTPKKVRKTMVHMVKELYYRQGDMGKEVEFVRKGIGIKEEAKHPGYYRKIREAFRFSNVKRLELTEKYDGVTVRFVLNPAWNGVLKVLAGMTVSNRPWSIMPSFKKVVGLAFATGSYMLIFTTLWQLSALYGLVRLTGLMLVAMMAMVTWIIFAHELWEKKTYTFSSEKLRWMYNASTISTLSIAVILFYISLFILFLGAVLIFVPPNIFQDTIQEEIGPADYLRLAWLATSAATVAGAIGAGLEKAEVVRTSTYGYRQYMRSKAIQKNEEEEQQKEGRE